MSNSAGCDLNNVGTVLKLHDLCHNPICKCQKQIVFTQRQFQLEGGGFKYTMKEVFKRCKRARDSFLRPAVITRAPVLAMAVGAKSKDAKIGQATTKILKSISGGRVLKMTDLLGNGLRLRGL